MKVKQLEWRGRPDPSLKIYEGFAGGVRIAFYYKEPVSTNMWKFFCDLPGSDPDGTLLKCSEDDCRKFGQNLFQSFCELMTEIVIPCECGKRAEFYSRGKVLCQHCAKQKHKRASDLQVIK